MYQITTVTDAPSAEEVIAKEIFINSVIKEQPKKIHLKEFADDAFNAAEVFLTELDKRHETEKD